jgi:recombination protein RecA
MSSPLAIRGVVPASLLGERPAPPTVSTGIAELDALTGGLPRGALSEICGPPSSGRTSVLLALMAETTRRGEVCALVDSSDCFDPQSAAAAGVELQRVLWVRCSRSIVDRRWSMGKTHRRMATSHQPSTIGCVEQTLKTTDLLLQGGGFGLVVVDLGDVPPEVAQRVPLTSWFRFRRVVENTPTVLLVLEQEPHARSCASVVIRLSGSRQSSVVGRQESNQQSAISIQPDKHGPAHARLLRGLNITVEIVRSTQQKKPACSAGAAFTTQAQWSLKAG